MKVLIFAAGLGTRLKPYTDNCPKALVEYQGKPLLESLILKLKDAGFSDLVINVHHFPDMIIDFLKKNNNFGINIEISDERDLLMDTGGGLLKAEKYLDGNESFLVHNVDIVTDLDLHKLIETHEKTGALATLAVRERETARQFLWDENMRLQGWQNSQKNEYIWVNGERTDVKPFAFSGVHVIHPDVFKHLHKDGPFSITPAYLELAKTFPIYGFPHNEGLWKDIGKVEALKS